VAYDGKAVTLHAPDHIQVSHIKPGTKKAAAHLKNYVRYVATREGVEKVPQEKLNQPATKKQQAMVERLLQDFPLSRGMFEYEDYAAAPTQGNASEFITRALEDNYDQIAKRENYVSYIAQRPRVERLGSHGLFNGTGESITLSKVAGEIANHPGNVWLPIISLRREDAKRLGYDSAKQWQALLTTYAPEIAEAMKIPWNQFRWYAAFHDEGHHPHIHMVCYSADGKSGFLNKDGIAMIKSGLAKGIFRQELTELYQRQTRRRDELVRKSGEVMDELIRQMRSGTLENPHMEQLMELLAQRLKRTSGKKQYGYLKAPLKALVDEIVDELARDPRVAAAYDLWYELREEVLRTYKNDLPPRQPLSRQKEFKRIKNLVIEEAVRLGEYMEVFAPKDGAMPVEQDRLSEVMRLTQAAEHGDACALYALGKIYLEEDDLPAALRWLQRSAELGNQYAQYALGKLYLLGKDVPRDRDAARWFALAAEQGNEYARFFLDHMDDTPSLFASATRLLHHMGNVFEEQAPHPAGGINFEDSKLMRRIREKKIAMGHKPDDHEEQVQQTM